jgi:hypothetical protein
VTITANSGTVERKRHAARKKMAHIAPLVVVLGFLAERRDERRHADHDQTTLRPASPGQITMFAF